MNTTSNKAGWFKQNKNTILFLVLMNIFFLFMFTSSPIYNHNIFVSDTGIYANIAKEMLNGKILYKDVFDHKGPLIFFIHMLTALIKQFNIGVYLMDAIIYNIAFYFQYKAILLKKNHLAAILIITIELILTMASYRILIPESVAFMAFSYMGYWVLSGHYLNPTKRELFFCGILTGFLFWLKFSLCAFVLVIYLGFLIKNFKPSSIIQPLIGFLIPTIGIVAYFVYNHAVEDLVLSYFLINTGYKYATFVPDYNFWILLMTNVGLITYSICQKDTRFLLVAIANLVLIIFSFILTGKNFAYYYIPLLAMLSLFSNVSFNMKNTQKLIKILAIILIVIFVILLWFRILQLNSSASGFKDPIAVAKDIGDSAESIAILFYGETAMLSHIENINYKYFFTPSLMIEQYPEMWKQIYEDISNKNIEYLMLVKDGDELTYYETYNNSPATVAYIKHIFDEIHNNYEVFNTYHNWVVFKRID